MPLIENQYSDRSVSNIKIKLNTIKDEVISSTANISHSKLNISWAIPVATVADLPQSANNGDVRVVLENNHIYFYSGTWKQETGRESYPFWLWTQDDRIYYSKNVGINTNDPQDSLHVNGIVRISNDTSYFQISSSGDVLSFDSTLYLEKSKKIGINTNSPQKDLDINGDIQAKGAYLDSIHISSTEFFFEENKLKFDGNLLIKSGIDPVVLFAYNETTFYKDVIIASGARLVLDADLLPLTTNSIGSSTASWINGYINSIYTNEIKNGNQKIFFNQSKVKIAGTLNVSERVETNDILFNNSAEFVASDSNLTLTIPASFSINSALESIITIDKDEVIINKNLTVKGNTTYIEATNTTVSDDEFVIKKGLTLLDGSAAFVVSRVSGETKIAWNDSSDRWELVYGQTANIRSNIITLDDFNSNVIFNANIGISVPNPSARIEIQTSAIKEINFIGTSTAEINSTPSMVISSSNDISLQTGGVVKLSKAGDVGIGKLSPVYSVDIISNDDKILRFKNAADSSERKLEVRSGNLYMTKDAVIELSIVGSNFGIGKNPIYDRLEIDGNFRLTNKITFTDIKNVIDFNAYKVGEINDASIFEIVDANPRISVTPDGVGIGTRTPQLALHVIGGANITVSGKNQDFAVEDLNKGSVKNVIWYEYPSSITYLGNLNASASSEVVIRGSEYVYNNVGVGKEPGDFKLRVYKETRFFNHSDITTVCKNNAIVIDVGFDENLIQPGIIWMTADDNDTKPKAAIWTKTSSSGTKLFIGTSKINSYGVAGPTLTVSPDSRVGINNENPLEALDVNGSIKALSYKSGSQVGQTVDVVVVTDVRLNAGVMQKKTKTMSYTGGILTLVSPESGWA